MAYFPMFIQMRGKRCLIVGGGKIAARKVRILLDYEVDLTVIAPEVCQEIEEYAREKKIQLEKRKISLRDCDEKFLVIGATNNLSLNKKIKEYCDEKEIFVNIIQGEEFCSFLFPAVVKRGDISVGITTGGKSPALAKRIRKQIEEIIPSYYGELNNILGWARERVIKEIGDEKERRIIFSQLTQEGIKKGKLWTKEEILEIIRKVKKNGMDRK